MKIAEELRALGDNPEFVKSVENIQPGYFRRGDDAEYQHRLVYTKQLRRWVYDGRAMNEILSEPELKELFFRTFGYTGNLNFTIYPSAWLRDLPLLDIGENAYLGDGILLGTNQVSRDQKHIKVGRIKIGSSVIFDQRCMIGLDSSVGDDCIIGIDTAIGLWCNIGSRVHVNARCSINHRCTIGDDVTLGYHVFLGLGAVVDSGVELPDKTHVPAHSRATKDGIVPLPKKG